MAKLRNVLVIGVGSIGERHVRCFQQTGRAAVSIVETNAELRARVAGDYGVEDFAELANALEQPFDAAVICTPAHTHLPIAIACAERGLHLLIEKPLSVELAGVEDLTRIVETRNLVAGVAYVYRSHPVLAAMRAELLSGRFGAPVQIVGTSGQHFPTYRPAYRDIYYARREMGGGAVQDALTHVLNAGEWLVGPITSVAADVAHQVLAGVDVEDTVGVLARHHTVLGTYSLNQHQAPNEMTMTVVCERGTIRFEHHQHRYRWISDPTGAWVDVAGEPLERDTLFVRQANAFLDALDGGPPSCTLRDGEQTLRVNRAVLTAAAERRWVEI